MKRDVDLIRAILLAVEGSEDSPAAGDLLLEGHEPRRVARHVELLQEGGFLVAQLRRGKGGRLLGARAARLTWRGCDFLDAARNESVWASTREMLARRGVTVPFDILAEMLRERTRSYLDLFEV